MRKRQEANVGGMKYFGRMGLVAGILIGIGAVTCCAAKAEANVVKDFALVDHKGAFHQLYYYAKDPQTRAIVLFVQGNGCPLVRKRVPQYGHSVT